MKHITTIYKNHFHIVEVDEKGNGSSISTKGNGIPEHSHRVLNNVVYASFEHHVHEIEGD